MSGHYQPPKTKDTISIIHMRSFTMGLKSLWSCISNPRFHETIQANLHPIWVLCNIIFVFLTCFHLTNYLDKKNTKGGVMSVDNRIFLLLQNKYSKLPSWAENLNKLFTVMGWKFKFSAQDRDLEYVFGEVKIFPYLLTLSHLYVLPSKKWLIKRTECCNLARKFVLLWKCKFASAT